MELVCGNIEKAFMRRLHMVAQAAKTDGRSSDWMLIKGAAETIQSLQKDLAALTKHQEELEEEIKALRAQLHYRTQKFVKLEHLGV